ncbi:aarF domain-containing protein kinase 1 isoform X2 [Ricinus communis]|uniref:aarF domain-containing protein kinase 1 isoform X2 n=1 Tax=Ricinus communis TaxID=3988 RepID=UPI00201A3D42|nr:aarF domain-containing protein kinase 1 isoform X2 [Ricinus communis]
MYPPKEAAGTTNKVTNPLKITMTTCSSKFKFPAAKARTAFYLITATGLTVHAANRLNFTFLPSLDHSSSLFPDKIRAAFHAVIHSSRAISTIAFTVADYKYSLLALPEDSDEYRRKLSEVHLRSAKRILKLCEANKGFYVKAGQFVAAMRQVPKEYSSTLSSLQDQAVPCHFKAIKEVLINNLGQDLSRIFLSFDEQPIAAASIAQVHRAVLKDSQQVAIKVQYPGLEQQMTIDTMTMSCLSKSVAWIFPDYRFDWLISEFTKAISSELDFIQEAGNSERTAKNFKNKNIVKVPQIFWELTTRQVLTMEFCHGHKVDDVEFLKEMEINPGKVAKALVEVFAEMIFIHGFVHGDPHPGNIFISPEGPNRFSLDDKFRHNYCQLWKALILQDSHQIEQLGERFNVGKYSRYFPVIFTGRTIHSKSALGKGMLAEEKKVLKQDLKSLTMEDISSFMESLPPDFLTILRTDGLLRSVLSKLGASQRVRLLTYAKYAVYGLPRMLNPDSDSAIKYAFSSLKTNVSYLWLRLIVEVLDLLSWLKEVKRFLYTLCRTVLSAAAMV